LTPISRKKHGGHAEKEETLGKTRLHAHGNSTSGKTKGYETSLGLDEGEGTKGMTKHRD
jgi:hypothetical protein